MPWFREDDPNSDGSDRFREGRSTFGGLGREGLVEGVYKNRSMLTIYQLSLLTILFIASVSYWSSRLLEIARSRRGLESSSSTRAPRGFLSSLTGFLMKQPGAEPWAMMMFIACYIIFTLIFCFYDMPNMNALILAFRFGLLATVNLPFLYILGTKNSLISLFTGWSYEQVNILHRYVGTVCVVAVFFHSVIFLYYYRFDYILHHLWAFMGFLAGTSFIIIGITSIPSVREMAYEFFYIVHLFGSVLAIPTVYFHFPTAQPHALLAGVAFIYDRAVRFLIGYKLVRSSCRTSSGYTVIMQIEKEDLNGWSWKPGQHIFITVIGCRTFESHPFTIASSYQCNNTLDLIIRAREGFSKDLYDQCTKQSPKLTERWVIVHGPYGVHPTGMPKLPDEEESHRTPASTVMPCETIPLLPVSTKQNKRTIVLISGGAGVAFTYPLYCEYRRMNQQALENQLPEPYDIRFLWIVPRKDFDDWIEMIDSGLNLWISREQGRPDIERLLRENLVPESGDCWIGTCGPEMLLKSIRNFVADQRSQGRTDIDFYAEKFGW